MSNIANLRDLYTVKSHQVQMMQDRGYNIPEQEQYLLHKPDESEQIFRHFERSYFTTAGPSGLGYRENMSNLYLKSDGLIYVYYVETPENSNTLSLNAFEHIIKLFIEQYQRYNNARLLIISEHPLTPDANKKIKNNYGAIDIDIFFYSMLYINPTKHFLATEHILLSADEGRNMLRSTNLTVDNLRKLSKDDMMVRWHGGRMGDIFKLMRDDSYINVLDNKSVAFAIVVDIHRLSKKKNKQLDMLRGKA